MLLWREDNTEWDGITILGLSEELVRDGLYGKENGNIVVDLLRLSGEESRRVWPECVVKVWPDCVARVWLE